MKQIAIIGAKGMVGQNLVNLYFKNNNIFSITRENIDKYRDIKFDLIFIAAADGRKYIANKDPYSDLISIMNLLKSLAFYNSEKIVLISTIDVYNINGNIGDEKTKLDIISPNYGSNRLLLELSLKHLFKEKLLVIRLQGLIANNLKKNLLYDIKHGKALSNFSTNTTFQFYPLNRLKKDIDEILQTEIRLCNLSAEPISIKELYSEINTQLNISNRNDILTVNYNVKSIHNSLSSVNSGYWILKKAIMSEIKNYLNIN